MASEDMAIRKCGSSWEYCDGNCNECYNRALTYSTTTEVKDEKS